MLSSTGLPGKVLMTADAVGGVWDYALELCRGFADADVGVVLAVMGPPPDPVQSANALCISGVELAVAPYRLEWMQDPWKDVAAAGQWLLDLEQRRGCDFVHLNGYTHGAEPFLSPKLVVGHSCVLSWWRAVKSEDAPPSWDRYRDQVGAGLHGADHVVAPSAWMLASLETLYGPLPPGEVIPNGRAVHAYGPGDKSAFVLSAGRLWDEGKNALTLARVASRVPWPVRIAGATPPVDVDGENTELCNALGFERAELLGRLSTEALAQLYAEAAIYALPARYEPFGLTVLEAAMSECALVLGDIPTLRELWNGAAVFVPPQDEGALETALLTLMNQPELTALLAARARRRALHYSATRMVKHYLALYRRILAARPRTAGAAKEVRASCVS